MNRRKLKRMTLGAMLMAMTAIFTAFVRIPLPVGYAHLGDGAVILSGVLLGPFGAICAAVGTALADLLSGYPIYIPFSIVIKAFMAFAAGRWLSGGKPSRRDMRILAAIMLCVPVGYFPADALYYGVKSAVLALAGNFAQAAVGYALSMFLLGSGIRKK